MQAAKTCEANLIVGGEVVSGVHCGVPIVERSFSAEPLQLPILCSAVPASAGAPPYLPGYQHCPRSLTRLCPEHCLPSSPAYSSCIAGLAQLCILSNDCDISALDISIVVSQTLNNIAWSKTKPTSAVHLNSHEKQSRKKRRQKREV